MTPPAIWVLGDEPTVTDLGGEDNSVYMRDMLHRGGPCADDKAGTAAAELTAF